MPRRLSPSAAQPAAPPIKADFYTSEWRRKQEHQAAGEEPGDAVAAAEAQPAASQIPDPEPALNPAPKLATDAPPPTNQPSLADSLIPQALNRIPISTDSGFMLFWTPPAH